MGQETSTVSVLNVYNMCPAGHRDWYLIISKLLPWFEHIVYGDVLWMLQCRIIIVWEVLHTFFLLTHVSTALFQNTDWENTNCFPPSTLQKPTFNIQKVSVTQDTLCPSEWPTNNTLIMSQKIMVRTGLIWLGHFWCHKMCWIFWW
jgi:hypothetical protein